MSLAPRALTILHEWVQSESLRKHCYAVADSMKYFAPLSGAAADVDLWEAVGLLHDMDYEKHPNLERSSTEGHPFVGVKWLREKGWSEEVCRAILSHADYSGVSPETPLENRSALGAWWRPIRAPPYWSTWIVVSAPLKHTCSPR